MGSTSSAIFTGSSAYSKDFENVITRAVSIASMPITQLTADKTTLSRQSEDLSSIDQKVAAVQAALDGIGAALDQSFDTSVSNPAALSATISAGAVEGNYSIRIVDAGAYSTMMTKTWSADSGAPHTFRLKIGSESMDVTPSDNSAASVSSAINRNYGDRVHATVVNVGSSASPDWRVSLQSLALTSDTLDLEDGGSLADVQTAGREAQYEVNNSGKTVSSASRTVEIADGVTLDLHTSSDDPVSITVTRSTSALNAAFGAFVSAYNSAVGALDGQRGTAGGSLSGNPLVAQTASALSGIATYVQGTLGGLAALGVELQKDGTLKQNQFVLVAMDLQNSAAVSSFCSDFLTEARSVMSSLEDPANGTLKIAQADLTSRTDDLTARIFEKQAEVDELQLRLQDRMAAADALVAAMEQQYSYLAQMFEATQSASASYK